MFKNYLKIAFRSLWKHKAHTFINVAGLSLGIACCILIALFVKDEITFDRFHAKADRIYRAFVKENWGENQEFFNTVTPFPLGPALKNNFPEVEATVRISVMSPQLRVGEQLFSEQVTIAGTDFFSVFDFEVIHGDVTNALSDMGNVVLTTAIAKRFFGEADPINKTITLTLNDRPEVFVVKAVTENVPTNSSIRFNVLISDLNYTRLYDERMLTSAWFNITPETYVLLRNDASATALTEKFPSVFKTILGEEDFTKSNYTVGLQPLTSIHLDTSFPEGLAPVSNPRYAYILSTVALLLLIVACINFVTLSIGRSIKRSREVGIRKVVGAVRAQLIFQFVGEAVLITAIALVLGVVLAYVCLPTFNTFAAKTLTLGVNSFTVGMGIVLLLIIGLIAGSYPAFVLSGFRPVTILKGNTKVGSKHVLRKILVGVQLFLSIVLVSGTLIMRDQLLFMQNKNLGFDKEHVLVVPVRAAGARLMDRIQDGFAKVEQFKGELTKLPDVAGVCGASHDFGRGDWTQAGYTDDNGVYRNFSMTVVEPDFLQMMNIKLLTGHTFDVNNGADLRRGVLVNEAFVRELGWEDAVGKRIPGKNFADHEVIGVTEDFHFASLHTKVAPLAIVVNPEVILSGIENININSSPVPKLFVKLRAGNMMNAVEQVKGVWDKLTGGEEFNFTFVDEALQAQYRSDQNLSKIISIATVLAMIIGSLGLYGLASLAMQGKIKEISIRKVFGATESSLLLLLSREYLVLVMVAFGVSVPVTWYFMSNWLAGFEYRVNIGVDVFILSVSLSLIVALIAIGWQTIKTTWAQPAETLKYE